ncbi:MAG: branched-chain amino acid transport system II carrier protein [Clostridiales Family XIII bacterium]|jgi:LIVCS family branched-chain amino acid:cation transporter|nr:branched-chain amino acid transport system II carrier protein [Clostridiales Family XIII bacterium]
MSETITSKQQSRRSIIISVGFMVFATFFGAGNLIFPPYLGFIGGGSMWAVGFIFFIIFDTVLGILGLAASGKYPQVELGVFYRPGRRFMIIIGAVATFIGSLLVVVPRTALTSYQIFLQPILAGGYENVDTQATGLPADAVIFLVVFLVLATFCAVRPTKVVDIVGRVLTPVLLVVLVVLIVIGLANMSGSGVRAEAYDPGSTIIAFGITQGLQTFDAATGTIIAVIIIASLFAKGITNSSEQTKMILRAGLVAAVCLIVIYLGLTLLGLFYSNDPTLMEQFGANGTLDQYALLNYIISNNLGFGGTVIFGITVLVATFTTAIGCISLTSEYFSRISGRKLSYKAAVIGGMVIAFIVAIVAILASGSTSGGGQWILNMTVPVLLVTAPITVVLIILNQFTDKIKNDNVFRGATIGAAIWGLFWGLAYIFVVSTASATAPLGVAGVPILGDDGTFLGIESHMQGFFNIIAVMFGSSPYDYFGTLTPDFTPAYTAYGSWNVIFRATGDLGYIIPAAVGGVIGFFIKKGGFEERPYLREHAGDDSFDFEALAAKKAAG